MNCQSNADGSRGLGPQTISAIVVVAGAHPEAQLIIAANEAFTFEHKAIH